MIKKFYYTVYIKLEGDNIADTCRYLTKSPIVGDMLENMRILV